MEFINQTGLFFFPLLLCSILATYISIERYIALRNNAIFPDGFLDEMLSGNLHAVNYSKDSLAGRLLQFFHGKQHAKDEKMLKAFVQLEIGRLESGLFILEVVTGIAPLIGLLGTVFGLTSVFGTFSPELEFSDPSSFVSGIALALNTTILGLLIAIPSLAMYAFFQRRIDVISHQLDLSIESLLYQDRVE
jgi:biopolymer transport protein ExbB